MEKGAELVFEHTPVGAAIQGLVALLNDAAAYTVSREAVHARFQKHGHEVRIADDIATLRLQQVDEVVGFLAARYKVAAGGEGAATGAAGTIGPWAGAAAIAIDLPAMIGMALRAIGEYGCYYGFPTTNQGEREFATHVLQVASSPEDATKSAAMAELTRVAVMLSKGATWEELNRAGSVKLIRKVAQSVSIRVTKAKLTYFVPILGAAVGGGFNAHYLGKVTTAAYYVYRERFLMRAYGEGWT